MSSSSPPLPLILLKTRSSPTDPYETYFQTHPLLPDLPTNPIFVPVLTHEHTNREELSTMLVGGRVNSTVEGVDEESGRYGCIIITSQRAVEALGAVVDRLKLAGHDLHALLSQTLIFVVGPATASAVVEIGFSHSNVLGAECGNGAVLAEFILSTLSPQSSSSSPWSYLRSRPILFLVGEIRRDVIPKVLKAAGIALTEMVVYKTSVVDGFKDDLERVLEETAPAPGAEDDGGRWVVVFSPQGADVAVEALKREEVRSRTRVAVIGPTTDERVKELGGTVEVVAGKPTPEGLWNAVRGKIGATGKVVEIR